MNGNIIVAASYATIQITIAIIVSIYGAIHVRQCRQSENHNNDKKKERPNNEEDAAQTTIEIQSMDMQIQAKADSPDFSNKQQKGFCEEWIKTVWKMRGVYSGLAVHSFDVLTDILVIIEWMGTANISGDHVDPQLMAYAGIGVVVMSKVVSAIAIWIKERDFLRFILQLFDLLIFLEIYESHKKLKRKFAAKDKAAIESTLSFKYLRNMEATFESIPQSILQLVYIMRDPKTKIRPVFIISIIQSIISMTNAILNHDSTQMQDDRFKKHKQRLPPTFQFMGHALSRFSEVVYRIGLLSLVWTVCGGLSFCIVIAIEFVFVSTRVVFAKIWDATFNFDTVLLAISFFIVIPAEDVYAHSEATMYFAMLCTICFCINFIGLMTFSILVYRFHPQDLTSIPGHIPFTRINVSFAEMMFVIIYAFFGENGTRKDFLVSKNHGQAIFIATCVFYFIYALFPLMFPDFSLPFNVNVRSKWGYAYSNEIEELKKINVPKRFRARTCLTEERRYPDVFKYDFGDWSEDPGEFWDETCVVSKDTKNGDAWRKAYGKEISAAMFALIQGNYEIVKWLESQGAKKHEHVSDSQLNEWFGDDLHNK